MSQKLHEIKLSPNISEHDMSYRIKWAEKWMEKGDKVKITLSFKGRENLHKDIGHNTMKHFLSQLKYDFEVGIKDVGKMLYCIIRPVSKK